jgi:hypothetical protein
MDGSNWPPRASAPDPQPERRRFEPTTFACWCIAFGAHWAVTAAAIVVAAWLLP